MTQDDENEKGIKPEDRLSPSRRYRKESEYEVKNHDNMSHGLYNLLHHVDEDEEEGDDTGDAGQNDV